MQRFVSLISLLAIVALLAFSLWLPGRPVSAAQGKGGEVIAKPTPTPRKPTTTRPKPLEQSKSTATATPRRTSSGSNRKRRGNGSTSTTNPQHETITNQLGMELVWVPPGSFMMGSERGGERPAHRVTFVVNEDEAARARIETANAEAEHATTRRELERERSLFEGKIASQAEYDAAQARYGLAKLKLDSLRTTTGEYGFLMGKYEVTQQQWQRVMTNNPSGFKQCPTCPVENVSWYDAQEFLDKLNDKNDGYRYRLPTEAEWEYACRAGVTNDDAAKLDLLAWYGKSSDGKTHPVGRLLPNAFGFYDMRGNVWEWCLDLYHENYDGAPADGSVWITGGIEHLRTIRGGSWYDGADLVRSAPRMYGSVPYHGENIGFRVVAVARAQ